METDLEHACREVVNRIRRDEFGIGVELNEDGQRLMKVQQERLGRSLDRLSKDLYSKDTHFVLGKWTASARYVHRTFLEKISIFEDNFFFWNKTHVTYFEYK
jgi:hypothetical protein